jgi:hypothetical protein
MVTAGGLYSAAITPASRRRKWSRSRGTGTGSKGAPRPLPRLLAPGHGPGHSQCSLRLRCAAPFCGSWVPFAPATSRLLPAGGFYRRSLSGARCGDRLTRSATMCAGEANRWAAHQWSKVSVALSWLRSSAFKVSRRASASIPRSAMSFQQPRGRRIGGGDAPETQFRTALGPPPRPCRRCPSGRSGCRAAGRDSGRRRFRPRRRAPPPTPRRGAEWPSRVG